MKIVHTADIHLDSPLRSLALKNPDLRERVRTASREAFVRIVDAVLENGAAALLIAGDLYDGQERSAKGAAFLNAQFDRLGREGVAVFCIRGNHDAENPVSGAVPLPGNVHVFDGRGGKRRVGDADVWVHGVSFSGRHAPDSLLGKFGAPVPGAVNIAMLHTSLAGAEGHDPYAPCTPAQLTGMGFDYWALGHVHKRQVHGEVPWIVMPGIPQGRDIGEAGAKSATLLTIGDDGIAVEEVPTAHVEFGALDIDVSGVEDADDLRRAIRAALAARADGAETILRVRLTGATPLCWTLRRDREVWAETVADMARETKRLWVETVSLDVAGPAPETGGTALANLAASMQAIREEESYREAARAELETVMTMLPPALRARLMPDEAAAVRLAERMAGAGAETALARMKGTAE